MSPHARGAVEPGWLRPAARGLDVLLLEPPLELHGQRDTGFKEVLPHIGIGYIAAVLREAGHRVHVLDAPAERLDLEGVCEVFRRVQPDFVGFSATTYQIHEVEETAKAFKAIDPEVRIAIGGSHASAVPGETLDAFGALDFAAYGEGEVTAVELLERLAEGETAEGVAGLAHRKSNGEIVVEPARPRLRDLDALPFPAFDLFPVQRYRGFYTLRSGAFRPLTLCTTRGCPYQCNFCYKSTGDLFMTRSPESVVAEAERDIALGANQLVFTDEVFTMKRSHVLKMLQALIDVDMAKRARWICQTRVDRVDPEILELMARAGCAVISYGVEAGNEEILNQIAKGITKERCRQAIGWTRDVGISPDTNFIIGNAYETRETIRETIDFAVELDPDTASFAILSPFPGTEVAEMAERGEGGLRLLSRDWRHYGKQIGSALELEQVPRAELERFHRMAYRRFYLRLGKLWRVPQVVNLAAIPVYLLHHLRSALQSRGNKGGPGFWGRERSPQEPSATLAGA